MKKALTLGLVASFFFAFTFVLNRSMNLSGGFWLWGAALRYWFTLPMVFVLLWKGKSYRPVLAAIAQQPLSWLLWSTVGFGLFYAPLCAASVFAESWFTCAVWEFTIVAGVLLTPLFGRRIPLRNLLCSLVIVAGIVLMQLPRFADGGDSAQGIGMLLLLLAGFAYPLGNRSMMALSQGLDTVQRVFGMTLCSMPFWCICSVIAGACSGAPSGGQLLQSACVALFSGVIATILFFRATDLVRQDPKQLAVIEATQSGEVIFTLVLGVIFLKDSMPDLYGAAGMGLIVIGLVINSLVA